MKLSACNQLKGKVLEDTKGLTTAHVRIDIGGVITTASVANQAVDDLALNPARTPMPLLRRRLGWQPNKPGLKYAPRPL